MLQKLKSFLANDAYFMAVLLVLVGISSFGLGRLSVSDSVSSHQSNRAAALQPLPALNSATRNNPEDSRLVIASRSGSKYHLPDCPGAQQIKPENRIEFTSRTEAEAAGYGPAGNCPALTD